MSEPGGRYVLVGRTQAYLAAISGLSFVRAAHLDDMHLPVHNVSPQHQPQEQPMPTPEPKKKSLLNKNARYMLSYTAKGDSTYTSFHSWHSTEDAARAGAERLMADPNIVACFIGKQGVELQRAHAPVEEVEIG